MNDLPLRRANVEMWRSRYAITKRALEQYEAENGSEDSIEHRRLVGLVNTAQQYLEDSLYLLHRAESMQRIRGV